MRRVTVIIDRPDGSTHQAVKPTIEKILKALKPLGVRVRITRSHQTLKEDKVWRK